MKKLLLLIVFILFLTNVNAWEKTTLGSDVAIESLTLNPYPVEPGQAFDITIKVHNINTKRTINSPRFTIQESYPFIIETQPKFKILNSLLPNEEALITFRIKVDADAITDISNLIVEYQENAGITYLSNPIKINIKTSGMELSVASIDTIPEEIYPGDEAQIKLVLKNTLPVLMKNIDINFDLSSISTPFMPLGTTTQRTLTTLNKGTQMDFLFDIAVDPEAEPKVYKVPLTINYEDEFGNPYTINTLTGIKVSTKPELKLNIEKTDIVKSHSQGKILIKISNTGLADLKFLTLKLQPSKDYDISSSQQIYIGNLESDDYETAEFNIYSKTWKRELPIKFLLTYRDSFNKEYEQEEIINLPLAFSLSPTKFIFDTIPGLIRLIIYLIIICFVYFTFKEWRKTKNLEISLKLALKLTLIKIKRIIKAIRLRTLRRAIKAIIRFMKEPWF